MQTINQRIAYARSLVGLNTAEMAGRVGISRQAMHMLETGGSKNPRPHNLLKIADITGVSIRWLISGEGAILRHRNSENHLDLSGLSPEKRAALIAVYNTLK